MTHFALTHVDIPALRKLYFAQKRLKICIAGGPHTGKTTLAQALGHELGAPWARSTHHTDDFKYQPWEEQALSVADVIESDESRIIEGVSVARGLRALLRRDPRHNWCDVLYIMERYKSPVTPAHISMTKGVITVLETVGKMLQRQGTTVLFLP